MNDARATNWQYLLPTPPSAGLLMPVADETASGVHVVRPDRAGLARALADGPYPCVVVPDLTGWACRLRDGDAAALLRELMAAVEPGGLVYFGFANAAYPMALREPGALRLPVARQVLARAGWRIQEAFLPFPDQTCPAYLVPVTRSVELRHFLTDVFFPLVEAGAPSAVRRRQLALRLMRRAALLSPHAVRVGLAPAVALVARRPT